MGQARDPILGWIDLFVIIGNNPVNASQPDRFVKVTLGRLVAKVGSEETLVLDDSAMKIDYVQATVGPHGRIDRAEALVGTGEELALLPDRIGVGLVQILFGRREGTLGNKSTHRIGTG